MNKISLEYESEQTQAQSIIITLSLIYLAIPNILFLWGWFTPWVAMSATTIIAAAIGRAIYLSFPRGANRVTYSCKHSSLMCLGLLVAFAICLYFLTHSGMLGILPSFTDLANLRNAMFANLRDAAWPLVLPNGKEMSYYLANVLPPALIARLLPSTGQWAVALWTVAAMILTLLMISSARMTRNYSWGIRLIITTVFLAIVCSPVRTAIIDTIFSHCHEWTGWDFPFTYIPKTHGGIIFMACGWTYNSCPPTLLLTAMLLVCRIRAEVVLPVAISLLVPLSPFGGLGLLPLVAIRWWDSGKQQGFTYSSLLLDSLLPLVMLMISVVYFLRADSETAVSLTPLAWGWRDFICNEIWMFISWLMILLPLCFVVKRNTFFNALLILYLLIPCIFIGTMSSSGKGGINELWFKTSPAYMLLIGYYWLRAWPVMCWYKYCYMGICFLISLMYAIHFCTKWGSNAYLEVDDRWNGHFNHDARFLNQSIPPCKEPMIPGMMFRNAGESEKHFPGALLPKAPGCDYTHPAHSDFRTKWL